MVNTAHSIGMEESTTVSIANEVWRLLREGRYNELRAYDYEEVVQMINFTEYNYTEPDVYNFYKVSTEHTFENCTSY